jgi:predicted DNA binding CopG/RHH family protein
MQAENTKILVKNTDKFMKKNKKIETVAELKFLKEIESGKYKPLSKKELEKEKARFQKIAANTLKRRSINIRVIESDIEKIKAIAMEEGMPYQTFITSILHKVATGKLVSASL